MRKMLTNARSKGSLGILAPCLIRMMDSASTAITMSMGRMSAKELMARRIRRGTDPKARVLNEDSDISIRGTATRSSTYRPDRLGLGPTRRLVSATVTRDRTRTTF